MGLLLAGGGLLTSVDLLCVVLASGSRAHTFSWSLLVEVRTSKRERESDINLPDITGDEAAKVMKERRMADNIVLMTDYPEL